MEIEEEWAKEKAERQAVSTMASPPRKPRGKLWVIALIVLVVGGIVTAGVIVQMHSKRAPDAAAARREGLIGVQIRANPPAIIRIDGHKAGKTPMTVHLKKGTQQVRIDAEIGGKTQTKLIVPDQDQDVGFTE
jgi:hypothetical protein